MNSFLIVLCIVVMVVFLIWLGLRMEAAPFLEFTQNTPSIKTIPLPANLPKPVGRYYRAVYGDQIPVITSAVLTGRATLSPFGSIALPSRFRFTHVAGKDYRHYIETTFLNIPFMKINERYIDGKARMELPFGTDEGDKLDQAANLGLWAETIWFPAVFLTTPRVKWQPVDDNTALLIVPFNETTDSFIVRFDPETGFVTWLESMRYKDSKSTVKILWINHTTEIANIDGKLSFKTGSITWMDDGKPWAFFTVENIVLNADVSTYIRQKGI
jgi:hypothetical protein